jgi:hypothetical protein
MLLTFHRSVYGRQLRLLMKDCRAYSRRHRNGLALRRRLCRHTHRARVKRDYSPGNRFALCWEGRPVRGGDRLWKDVGSLLDVNLKKK